MIIVSYISSDSFSQPQQSIAEYEHLAPYERQPSPFSSEIHLASASTFIRRAPGEKYRPRLAGEDGRNLPLEVIRCLDDYMSVLDARGTVPGSSFGGLVGSLAGMEDSLTSECML